MLLDADLREARFVEERLAGELDTAAVFLRLEARLFVALLAVVFVLFLLEEAALLVAVFLTAFLFVAVFLFGAAFLFVADLRLAVLRLADFLLAVFLAVDFLEVVRFTDFLLVARFFVEDAGDLRRWLNMACLLLIYVQLPIRTIGKPSERL